MLHRTPRPSETPRTSDSPSSAVGTRAIRAHGRVAAHADRGGGSAILRQVQREQAATLVLLRCWGCAWIAAAVVAGGVTCAHALAAPTLPHLLGMLPALLVVAGALTLGVQQLRPTRFLAVRLGLFLATSALLAAVLDAPAQAPWLCSPAALAAALVLAVPPLVATVRGLPLGTSARLT